MHQNVFAFIEDLPDWAQRTFFVASLIVGAYIMVRCYQSGRNMKNNKCCSFVEHEDDRPPRSQQ